MGMSEMDALIKNSVYTTWIYCKENKSLFLESLANDD